MKIDKKASIPVYLQLKNKLAGDIREGVFTEKNKFPSENDLSLKYLISRLTVRKALIKLEDEGLIYTVHGKGRFVVHKSKSENPTDMKVEIKCQNLPEVVAIAGLSEVDLSQSVISILLTEFTRLLYKQNTSVKFITMEQLRHLKEDAMKNIKHLIIYPHINDMPMLYDLIDKGIFVIGVNRPLQGGGIPYVAINQYSGVYQLVRDMINAGHRDIACIAGNIGLNKYMQERVEAFKNALEESNIEFKPEYLLEIDNPFEDFTPLLDKFFKKNQKLTALFITGEGYQIQTLKYLIDSNKRIPDDISVAAVDEVLCIDTLPKITCLRQPMEEVAARVITILNEISASGNPKSNRGEMLYPIICDNGTIKNIK